MLKAENDEVGQLATGKEEDATGWAALSVGNVDPSPAGGDEEEEMVALALKASMELREQETHRSWNETNHAEEARMAEGPKRRGLRDRLGHTIASGPASDADTAPSHELSLATSLHSFASMARPTNGTAGHDGGAGGGSSVGGHFRPSAGDDRRYAASCATPSISPCVGKPASSGIKVSAILSPTPVSTGMSDDDISMNKQAVAEAVEGSGACLVNCPAPPLAAVSSSIAMNAQASTFDDMLAQALEESLELAREQARREEERNRAEAQAGAAEMGKVAVVARVHEDVGRRIMGSPGRTGAIKSRQGLAKTTTGLAWKVKNVEEVLEVRPEQRGNLRVLVGTEGQFLQHIRASWGLDVRILDEDTEIRIRFAASSQGRALFGGEEGSEEEQENQLMGFKADLSHILKDPQRLIEERLSRYVHVLIDWSNIVFSAGSGSTPDLSHGVDAKRFAALLEQDENVMTKFMATSTHPLLDPGTAMFRQLGYVTRVEARGKEGFVDGSLQLKLMEVATKEFRHKAQHIIRLATGDGNMHDEHGQKDHERACFPKMVEDALRNGYKVELWTWRRSCSHKYFEMLQYYHPRFMIQFCDNFRDFILPGVATR